MTAHETYMRTALEAAREAARLGEIPVGACIVRDGEILSVGYNTRESERDPLGHAEINAIRQACQRLGSWRLDGCVLSVSYTHLIISVPSPAGSKPDFQKLPARCF